MVKVLEHGIRKITCPYCKAKLQYEQEDIYCEKRLDGRQWIVCPDCKSEITLNTSKSSKEKDDLDDALNSLLPY